MKIYREERYRIYLESGESPSDLILFDRLVELGIVDLGESASLEFDEKLNRYDLVTLHEIRKEQR
jgi:hypothetical protein